MAKRLLFLLPLFLVFGPVQAQERLTISEFLSRKDAKTVPYVVVGTFDKLLSQDDLVFTIRDTTGAIRVKLFQNGPKTALYFHAMNLCPGDTVVVSGKQAKIWVEGKGTKKGMDPATIVSKSYSPNHDSLGVTRPPSFQGKGPGYFSQWVNSCLVYPKESKLKKTEGTVILCFTVTKEGKVADVIVKQSSGDSALDEEAIRVVSLSPLWFPGTEDGVPVDAEYTFPVVFSLK